MQIETRLKEEVSDLEVTILSGRISTMEEYRELIGKKASLEKVLAMMKEERDRDE